MRVLPHANQIKDIDQEHMQWLRDLPATLDFDTVGGSLLLCHGLGKNDMKTLLPDESGYALSSNEALENLLYETSYRFVIKGHSHTRMVRRIDRITFINAGTLRATSEPCFCIIDFEKKQLQFFDFINSEITPLDAVPLP
jgi:predicted phosphodiesterase